jgi:hypothetical protein
MFRLIVGRNDMTIRNLAYTALVGAAAIAFVIGSAVPSEAAKKKKAAAAPPPQPPSCFMITPPSTVCATKGGQQFTYFNSCYAAKDQATNIKAGACKPAKAAMAAKGGGKKKASKKKM